MFTLSHANEIEAMSRMSDYMFPVPNPVMQHFDGDGVVEEHKSCLVGGDGVQHCPVENQENFHTNNIPNSSPNGLIFDGAASEEVRGVGDREAREVGDKEAESTSPYDQEKTFGTLSRKIKKIFGSSNAIKAFENDVGGVETVSYTHLTLPTMIRV